MLSDFCDLSERSDVSDDPDIRSSRRRGDGATE